MLPLPRRSSLEVKAKWSGRADPSSALIVIETCGGKKMRHVLFSVWVEAGINSCGKRENGTYLVFEMVRGGVALDLPELLEALV